jgi:DNA-binding NarL/FixJ family response regulator/Flp pilus assembly pilin Flp
MWVSDMPIEGPVRVLVVDDHIGIRNGISSLIEAEQPLMCSVGSAASAAEALAQARERQPHVVVLDVNLAGDDGLALIPALQRAARCQIVVLTCLADPRVASHARRMGARACLHKTAPAADLLACILAAGHGDELALTTSPSSEGVDLSRSAGNKHPSVKGNTADANAGSAAYSESALHSSGLETKGAGNGNVISVKEESSMKLVQFIRSFIREEDGAAAIEYGLIAALIAVAIIGGSIALGTSLDGLFTDLGTCMANPSVANCVLGG